MNLWLLPLVFPAGYSLYAAFMMVRHRHDPL